MIPIDLPHVEMPKIELDTDSPSLRMNRRVPGRLCVQVYWDCRCVWLPNFRGQHSSHFGREEPRGQDARFADPCAGAYSEPVAWQRPDQWQWSKRAVPMSYSSRRVFNSD